MVKVRKKEAQRPLRKFNCLMCDTEYQTRARNSKYCPKCARFSNEAAKRAWGHRKIASLAQTDIVRRCMTCNNTFHAPRCSGVKSCQECLTPKTASTSVYCKPGSIPNDSVSYMIKDLRMISTFHVDELRAAGYDDAQIQELWEEFPDFCHPRRGPIGLHERVA